MIGTEQDDGERKARQPSPLVAETAERLRDIGVNGAEPWNDPIAERRERRRKDMEILRIASMEAAIHVTEYICGRLPAWKRDALEDIDNPVAALANLNRSIVQITLAEDRFDESDEERAARIAAEAEARLKAETAAEAERVQAAGQLRRAENKRQIVQTVRAITLQAITPAGIDGNKELDRMMRELEAGDGFDGDPADIVADICLRLGASSSNPAGRVARYRERKADMIALARAHLAALRPADEAEKDKHQPSEAANRNFAASAKAQGPPN